MSNQKITWGKPLVEYGKTGAEVVRCKSLTSSSL